MFGLMHILKQAIQGLRQNVVFVSAVILTMAITLGALFCIISLSYYLLIKPLPYPDQNQLFSPSHIQFNEKNELKGSNLSFEALYALYEDKSVFNSSTLMYYAWDLITSTPSQPRVNTISTSPEYFELFDIPMAIGRGFQQTEAVENKNPVAVISYEAWRKHFGLNENVLSQKITLGGVSYSIVGVIAKNFVEPQLYQIGLKSEVWIPWDVSGAASWAEGNWANKFPQLKVIGHLKEGISISQAEQKLSTNFGMSWMEGNSDTPDSKKWVNKVELTSIKDTILGNSGTITIVLLIATIGLLLLAITNIANLFISRTSEQVRQLAIRSVLGAKKKHLFNLIFSEIILLMIVSGVIALIIANFGISLMITYLSDVFPQVSDLSVSAFTLTFSIVVIVIIAYIFSKISSQIIDYKNLNQVLQSSGKGTGVQVSSRTREVLIILQVSIASFLVFCNIILFNQALKPLSVSKGFDIQGVYSLYLVPNTAIFPSIAERISFTQAMKKKLLAYPQIISVSHSNDPLQASRNGLSEYVSVTSDISVNSNLKGVDHNYFQLLGITILKGDGFSAIDIQNNNQSVIDKNAKNFNMVVVVNENFAKKLDENMDVIGKFIRKGESDTFRIIGIVNDHILPPAHVSQPTIYTVSSEAGFDYIIKYKNENILSRKQIVSLVQEESSLYSPYIYASVEKEYKMKIFREKLTTIITSILCILVLFLAAVGLYGILSFSINSRRLELGIRMAIGAKKRNLIIMVFKNNFPSILWGFVGSLILASIFFFVFKDNIAGYLNLSVIPVLVLTVLILLTVSVFSCYIPLRKYINQPVIKSLKGS